MADKGVAIHDGHPEITDHEFRGRDDVQEFDRRVTIGDGEDVITSGLEDLPQGDTDIMIIFDNKHGFKVYWHGTTFFLEDKSGPSRAQLENGKKDEVFSSSIKGRLKN